MSDSVRTKFHFFQVERDQDTPLEFEEALERMWNMPSERKRKEIAAKGLCLLSDVRRYPQNIAYLFTKIRMTEIPDKVNALGKRDDLDLEEDEGLGEDVALGYSPSWKIAAIQANRYSLSSGNIATLISKSVPEARFAFHPVIVHDALERFSQMQLLRKMRVKLAGAFDFGFLQDKGLSASDAMAIQAMLEAPFVDIVLSVGRRRGALHEKFKAWTKAFLKIAHSAEGAGQVKMLEITGKEDDDAASVAVDLLTERLVDRADIPLDAKRKLDKGILLRSSCDVLEKNWENLRYVIPPNGQKDT